ncbi:MAG: rhodanese-related sulfurtransferase [Arcticibacterium sp.]
MLFSRCINKNKLKKTLISIVSFVLTTAPIYGQVESSAFNLLLKAMIKETVPTVSVEDLSKENSNEIVLLDARERAEYEVSHLYNARWIGFEDFNESRLAGLSKNQEIVIYCSIGVRSEKIGERLLAAGYTNVRNLYGSIFEWVNQENEVYGLDGKPTNRVHAYSKTWGVWLKEGDKVY